jgi:hypothetical protein
MYVCKLSLVIDYYYNIEEKKEAETIIVLFVIKGYNEVYYFLS